ncbi:hypothetical protein GALL_480700 [mine drainage metagenome]|uniref:Uncharacterized protein n=1 Tax=mine drainage metagenome TaxID=410659 RepID=A0A1J5PRV4_9ZZZZ
MPGDPPLDGSVVGEPREHLVQHPPVQHAAAQVLGAGRLAALDQDDREALLGEPVRRHRAGGSGTDDDDVEVRLGGVGHDRAARNASARSGTTV